jgi:chaperonin cofactor prefoldin
MLGKFRSLTGQFNDVQLDRDQLASRFDQLQKVLRDVDEGDDDSF